MRSLLMSVFVFLGAVAAQANEFAVTGGARFDNADSGTTGTTVEARLNLQAGLLGFIELGGKNYLRTGAEFATRSYGFKTTTVSLGDARFTSFDVPVGYLYRFSDYGGIFAGGLFTFNFSKDCPGGCTGASSSPIGLQFGSSFKIAPQIGGEVYFEMMNTKLANGIENAKAVVGQLYFSFD